MSNYRTNNLRADQFKALSNTHRLELFKRLMACCTPGASCDANATTSYCVGDLGKGLDVAPSTLSHHLKELKYAGLIKMEKKGKSCFCSIEPDVISDLAQFFTFNEQPRRTVNE